MNLKRFEDGIGIPIEEFLEIITNGFYYIDFKDKSVYFLRSQCVFVGNGYCPHSNSMVRVYPLFSADDKEVKDGHYWDWKKENSVFNFEDYNKTWSIDSGILEEKLKELNN